MVSKIFDTYDIQCTYNELNEKFKRDCGAVFTSSYFFSQKQESSQKCDKVSTFISHRKNQEIKQIDQYLEVVLFTKKRSGQVYQQRINNCEQWFLTL